MGRTHRLALTLAVTGLQLAASAAGAQTIYRCSAEGRILYTTVPCDDGTVVVAPHLKPSRASVATAAAAAPAADESVAAAAPPAPAVRTLPRRANETLRSVRATPRGLTFDAGALERACRDGERRACDLRGCLETNDAGACARAEGRLAGATWRELSRITQTLPAGDAGPGAPVRRETAVTIECLPGRLMRTVHVRPDLSAMVGRGGDTLDADRPAGRAPGQVQRFGTIDEAAAFVCSTLAASRVP